MGKSPLILAALAKGAAPSLNIVKVQKNSMLSDSHFDGALLTSDEGRHYIVRIAKNAAAETNQEAELRALKALAKNGTLPFTITSQLASSTTRDGELVRVLNYVYGAPFDLAEIDADDSLVASVANALAAIHNLPLSVVEDIHFPEYTASSILKSTAAEIDRAMETGKVPSVLLNRWEDALSNENLFRFMPTVINGLLSPESVLELDGEVSGILDWMDLQIGDPARDFGWVLARGHDDLVYNLLLAYQHARPGADDNIRQRAQLYSEIAWANYLVSAVNSNNENDILDAQGELEILAAQVESGTALRLTPTAFAAPVAATQVIASQFAVPQTPSSSTAFDDESDEFVEPTEPIYSSFNYDKPLVDFAPSPYVAEPAPVHYDDTATAPIEIVAYKEDAPAAAESAAAEASDATAEASDVTAEAALPPFLTEDLPSFLLDEELDKRAKDELF